MKSKYNSKTLVKKISAQRYLLLLSVPFVLWLIIFAYIPLAGWLMAFQDYKPNLGFFGSKWVGLKQFIRMFTLLECFPAIFTFVK